MRRKILHGLEVEDFIHPRESTAKKFANASSAVRNFLGSASSLCATAVDPVTQGTFVKISAPKLLKIASDVCRILDVSPVPEIYLCHLMSRDIMPLGSDAPYLVVPDYTLRYSDDDMLYYNFGNAVAMIKADHVELEMLAAYMPGGMLVNAARIIFTQYLHCADATSDRGGLLACQSFAAAVRNHFWELIRFFDQHNGGKETFFVIQLDDVDSQIKYGYQVMDDIRKYLVIPNQINQYYCLNH